MEKRKDSKWLKANNASIYTEHDSESVEVDIEGSAYNYFWVCGNCHGQVNWMDKECKHCYRRLKWDE